MPPQIGFTEDDSQNVAPYVPPTPEPPDDFDQTVASGIITTAGASRDAQMSSDEAQSFLETPPEPSPEPDTSGSEYFNNGQAQANNPKYGFDSGVNPDDTAIYVSNDQYFSDPAAFGGGVTPPDPMDYFNSQDWSTNGFSQGAGWFSPDPTVRQRQADNWNAEVEKAIGTGDWQKVKDLEGERDQVLFMLDQGDRTYQDALVQFQNTQQANLDLATQRADEQGYIPGEGGMHGFIRVPQVTVDTPDGPLNLGDILVPNPGAIAAQTTPNRINDLWQQAQAQLKESQARAFMATQSPTAGPGLKIAGTRPGDFLGADAIRNRVAAAQGLAADRGDFFQVQRQNNPANFYGDPGSLIGEARDLGLSLLKGAATGISTVFDSNMGGSAPGSMPKQRSTGEGPNPLGDAAGLVLNNLYLADRPFQFVTGVAIEAVNFAHPYERGIATAIGDTIRNRSLATGDWSALKQYGKEQRASFAADNAKPNTLTQALGINHYVEQGQQFSSDHPYIYFAGSLFLDPLNKFSLEKHIIEPIAEAKRARQLAMAEKSLDDMIRIGETGGNAGKLLGVDRQLVTDYLNVAPSSYKVYNQMRTGVAWWTQFVTELATADKSIEFIEPIIKPMATRLYLQSATAKFGGSMIEGEFEESLRRIWNAERDRVIEQLPSSQLLQEANEDLGRIMQDYTIQQTTERGRVVNVIANARDKGQTLRQQLVNLFNQENFDEFSEWAKAFGYTPFPITSHTFVVPYGATNEELKLSVGERMQLDVNHHVYGGPNGQAYEVIGDLPFNALNEDIVNNLPSGVTSPGPDMLMSDAEPIPPINRLPGQTPDMPGANPVQAEVPGTPRPRQPVSPDAPMTNGVAKRLIRSMQELNQSVSKLAEKLITNPDARPRSTEELLTPSHVDQPVVRNRRTGGASRGERRRPSTRAAEPEAVEVTKGLDSEALMNQDPENPLASSGTAISPESGEEVPRGQAEAENNARATRNLTTGQKKGSNPLGPRVWQEDREYLAAHFPNIATKREQYAALFADQPEKMVVSALLYDELIEPGFLDKALAAGQADERGAGVVFQEMFKPKYDGRMTAGLAADGLRRGMTHDEVRQLWGRSRVDIAKRLQAYGVKVNLEPLINQFLNERPEFFMPRPNFVHFKAPRPEQLDLIEHYGNATGAVDVIEKLEALGPTPNYDQVQGVLNEVSRRQINRQYIQGTLRSLQEGTLREVDLAAVGLSKATLEQMTVDQAVELGKRKMVRANLNGFAHVDPDAIRVVKQHQAWLNAHLPFANGNTSGVRRELLAANKRYAEAQINYQAPSTAGIFGRGVKKRKTVTELLDRSVAGLDGVEKIQAFELQHFLMENYPLIRQTMPHYAPAVDDILNLPMRFARTDPYQLEGEKAVKGIISKDAIDRRYAAVRKGLIDTANIAPVDETHAFSQLLYDIYYSDPHGKIVDQAVLASNRARLGSADARASIEAIERNYRLTEALRQDEYLALTHMTEGTTDWARQNARVLELDGQMADMQRALAEQKGRPSAIRTLAEEQRKSEERARRLAKDAGVEPRDAGRPNTPHENGKESTAGILDYAQNQGSERPAPVKHPTIVDPSGPRDEVAHPMPREQAKAAAETLDHPEGKPPAPTPEPTAEPTKVPTLGELPRPEAADTLRKEVVQRELKVKRDATGFEPDRRVVGRDVKGPKARTGKAVLHEGPESKEVVEARMAREQEQRIARRANAKQAEANRRANIQRFAASDSNIAAAIRKRAEKLDYEQWEKSLTKEMRKTLQSNKVFDYGAYHALIHEGSIPTGDGDVYSKLQRIIRDNPNVALAAKTSKDHVVFTRVFQNQPEFRNAREALKGHSITPRTLYEHLERHYDVAEGATIAKPARPATKLPTSLDSAAARRQAQKVGDTVLSAGEHLSEWAPIPESIPVKVARDKQKFIREIRLRPEVSDLLEQDLTRSEFTRTVHNRGLDLEFGHIRPEEVWEYEQKFDLGLRATQEARTEVAVVKGWLNRVEQDAHLRPPVPVTPRHIDAIKRLYLNSGMNVASIAYKNLLKDLELVKRLPEEEAEARFAKIAQRAYEETKAGAIVTLGSGVPLDRAAWEAWQTLRTGYQASSQYIGRSLSESFDMVNSFAHSLVQRDHAALPILGTQAIGLRDADWKAVGGIIDAWADEFYKFDDVVENAGNLHLGNFGKNLGMDPTKLQDLSVMMRVGDSLGMDLMRFLDAAHATRDPYEAARALVTTLSFGSLEDVAEYAPFYLSSDTGREALRAWRTHGPTVLENWEQLVPKQSLGDLPKGVLPAIRNGTWTKQDLAAVEDWFTSKRWINNGKDLAPLERAQAEQFRLAYRDRFVNEVLPHLKNPRTGDWLLDEYHVMNDVDPFMFEGELGPEALAELTGARKQIRAELEATRPALTKAHEDSLLARKVAPNKWESALAAEQKRIDAEFGRLEEQRFQAKRGELRKTAILGQAPEHDLGLLFDRIGAYGAELEGRRLAARAGKTFEEFIDLPPSIKLMMGIKGNLAALWMTAWPGYHFNNFVGNVMSQVIGSFRNDTDYSALPMRDRLGMGLINRAGSGELGYGHSLRFHSRKAIDAAGGELGIASTRGRLTEGKLTKRVGGKINPQNLIGSGMDAVFGADRRFKPMEAIQGAVDFIENYAHETVYSQALANKLRKDWPARLNELIDPELATDPSLMTARKKLIYPALTEDEAAQLKVVYGLDEVQAKAAELGLPTPVVDKLVAEHRSLMQAAGADASRQVRDVLRDYRMRNRLDGILDRVIPVHFWSTKNAAFITGTILDRPAVLAAVLSGYDSLIAENQGGFDNRLKSFTIPEQVPLIGGKTVSTRVWNMANPMLAAMPKFLANVNDDWDRYKDMGLGERILAMGYSGTSNAWESLGLRIGPHWDWLQRLGLNALPRELDKHFGTNLYQFYDADVRDAGGKLIHRAGDPKSDYAKLLVGINKFTEPGGFRNSWLPFGGFENLATSQSETLRNVYYKWNSTVYGSPITHQQIISTSKYIATLEKNKAISHDDAVRAIQELNGYQVGPDGHLVTGPDGTFVRTKPNLSNPVVKQALGDLANRGALGYLSSRLFMSPVQFNQNPDADSIAAAVKDYRDASNKLDYSGTDDHFTGTIGPEAQWLINQVKAGKVTWDQVDQMFAQVKAGENPKLWQDARFNASELQGYQAGEMDAFIKQVHAYEKDVQTYGYGAAYRKYVGFKDRETGEWVPGEQPWLGTYLAVYDPTKYEATLKSMEDFRADWTLNQAVDERISSYYQEKAEGRAILQPVYTLLNQADSDYQKRVAHASKNPDGSINTYEQVLAQNIRSDKKSQAYDQEAKLLAENDMAVYKSFPTHGQAYYGRDLGDRRFLEANDVDQKAMDATERGQAQKGFILDLVLKKYGLDGASGGKFNDQFQTEDPESGRNVFDQHKYDEAVKEFLANGTTDFNELAAQYRKSGINMTTLGAVSENDLKYHLSSNVDPKVDAWYKERSDAVNQYFDLLKPDSTATAQQIDGAKADIIARYGADYWRKSVDHALPSEGDAANGVTVGDAQHWAGQVADVMTYYRTLTPAGKDALEKEFANGVVTDDAHPKGKFDAKQLTGDQLDAIMYRAANGIEVEQNRPTLTGNYSIAGQDQAPQQVISEYQRQQITDQVYQAATDYFAGAGLSPDQLEQRDIFNRFLADNAVMEAQAKADKEKTGLSWVKLGRTLDPNSEEGQYVSARLSLMDSTDQNGLYNAQKAWVEAHPLGVETLAREYPTVFGKFGSSSSTSSSSGATKYVQAEDGTWVPASYYDHTSYGGTTGRTSSSRTNGYSTSGSSGYSTFSSRGSSTYSSGPSSQDPDIMPVIFAMDPVLRTGGGDDYDARVSIASQVVDKLIGRFAFAQFYPGDFQRMYGFLRAMYLAHAKKILGDNPGLADWQKLLDELSKRPGGVSSPQPQPGIAQATAPGAPLDPALTPDRLHSRG